MAGATRIGILTSGGDAPGMTPAIRAAVRAATGKNITCIGIRRGSQGLINGDVFELNSGDVAGLSNRGGTILYTARSEEFRTEAGVKKAAQVCGYLGIDGIISIGGDGTFRGAAELARQGIRVVSIPATIDNDMGCTEYTIGFDTACNTAIEAIDKLRDTGQSHDRVSVVEVMGRNAGHLALYTGGAAGASAVLIFVASSSPFAQPWAVLAGNLLAALIG
ncbi:MAG: ATP-dependent 6-phosphofructokinase, partial [Oscillospiraceae bacterium]|nr:ATP-dependent 6-phosphofructokinase [Oscillospiraceae bacterium]